MGGGKDRAKKEAQRIEDERKRVQRERASIEAENQRKADAGKRRRLGRSSLITNLGSELGITDDLG